MLALIPSSLREPVLNEDGAVGDTDDDTPGETDNDARLLPQPAAIPTNRMTTKIILTAVYDDERWPLGSPDLANVSDTTCIVTDLRSPPPGCRSLGRRADRRL